MLYKLVYFRVNSGERGQLYTVPLHACEMAENTRSKQPKTKFTVKCAFLHLDTGGCARLADDKACLHADLRVQVAAASEAKQAIDRDG